MIEPEDEFEPPASMTELLEEALADLAGVDRANQPGGVALSRAGHPFAVLAEGVLDVRLDPLVAAAALRTPDATDSSRGTGWIRFAPSQLDRYAVDRVTAWLGYAWRHALD